MTDQILESLFLDVPLWAEVIDHGVSRGIPSYVVEQLQDPHFRADLCRQIAEGEYVIAPPHTGYCPKDDGRERMFLVNEPLDRLLLHAVYKWLLRHEPEMIHPSCLSYQEGIGIGQVVRQLSAHITAHAGTAQGGVVGRKFDIQKYFDSVDRRAIHRAFDVVEQHHGRSSVISLLRRYFDSDLYYDSRQHSLVNAYQGIKQGCAVSSWLANVILYDLDEALSAMPGFYVRYSDDIIYVGEQYVEATQAIRRHLEPLGLVLNEQKIEDVNASRFVRFLGYGVRGAEITLSRKWVKHFQTSVDRRTIRNRHLIARVRNIRRQGGPQMHTVLDSLIRGVQRSLVRYLYLGDGRHSWASMVLSVVNRPDDVACLNRYCLDALRAVYTGKTDIGGVGFSAEHGIIRGKGRHVRANRQALGRLVGYHSLSAMQQLLPNRWLYRAMVAHLLDVHDYPAFGGYAGHNGDQRDLAEPVSMMQGLEERYEAFLNSEPDRSAIERFYARPLEQMDTLDLLASDHRSVARDELMQWLSAHVSFDALQTDADAWYWQSAEHPQLVLLRDWF